MGTNAAHRTFIEDISASSRGEVLLRGWVYRLRVLGKTSFIVLRDCSGTAQCVAATETLQNHRLKVEDVLEIRGIVREDSRSKAGFEIHVREVQVLNRAGNTLPFQSADDVEAIGLDTLLQFRPLALRTEAVGDVFRIRAAMLLKLMGGRAVPAGELALAAHISPQTASEHLAQLTEAGFVAAQRRGRHRYYELADDNVAYAVESLLVLSPAPGLGSSRTFVPALGSLQHARRCYSHLAGWLGVAIADALQREGYWPRRREEGSP